MVLSFRLSLKITIVVFIICCTGCKAHQNCSKEMYYDQRFLICTLCQTCGRGERVESPCSPSTKCVKCIKGKTFSTNNSKTRGDCKNCSICANGTVAKCNISNDTVCATIEDFTTITTSRTGSASTTAAQFTGTSRISSYSTTSNGPSSTSSNDLSVHHTVGFSILVAVVVLMLRFRM